MAPGPGCQYSHHLVTIALVGTSYAYNYLRVGVLVLYLHDVSDVVGDLVKIFNYLQLEGLRGLFLLEAAFVTLLGSWFYYRLYRLPQVIWLGVLQGAREVAAGPGSECMAAFDEAHATPLAAPWWQGMQQLSPLGGAARVGSSRWAHLGFPSGWKHPGDGTFNVVSHLSAMPIHPCLPLYWESGVLLVALQAMQVVWYLLFLRILYRLLLVDDSAHETGRDEYEGDSDDDSTASAKPKQR